MRPSANSQANKQGSGYGSSNQQGSRIPPFVIASLWMGLGGYALTSFVPVAMAMIAYGFSFLLSHRSFAQSQHAKNESVAQATKAEGASEAPQDQSALREDQAEGINVANKTGDGALETCNKHVGAMIIPIFFMALGITLGALFPPVSPLIIGTGIAAALLALLVAGLVVKRKATITTGFILSALAALVMIAAEAIAARLHGQTLLETLAATTSDTVQSIENSLPLSVQAQVSELIPLVQMLWPFVLFCAAGIAVACAHAAARIAQLNVAATQRKQITMWRLSAFDTPLWAPFVLVIGIACFAFSPALMGASQSAAFWVQSAGLSIIMAVRIIFFLDGAATLSWFLEQKKWGCLIRILIWIVAFYLEGFCFLLSIIGFIDFWANFRKRNRTRKHTIR